MTLVNVDHETPAAAWIFLRTTLVLSGIATLGVLGLRLTDMALASQSSIPNYVVAAVVPAILGAPFVLQAVLQRLHANIANARLDALAATEQATGLLNRRAFSLRVNARLQEATPGGTRNPGALLVIQADELHLTNPESGYASRNMVLTRITHILRQCREEGAYLGHFGHGEFVLFMPNADDAEAHRVAVRIGTTIAKARITLDGRQHALSVSIGGALANDQSSFATLYNPASQRTAAASTAGGNRALLQDPHTSPLAKTAHHIKGRKAA